MIDRKVITIDDTLFIKNLFLMIRTKRYELKKLIKSLKSVTSDQIIQLARLYGISTDLMNNIFQIINQDDNIEISIKSLENFIIEKYEKIKENKKK